MQSISDLIVSKFIEKNDKNKITNERQSALKPFVDAMPSMKPSRIAFMASHVKTADLYSFFKDCQRAKNFTGYFVWALTKKK